MNRREVQKDLKVRRRRKENTGKLKRKIIKAFPVRFSGSFVSSPLFRFTIPIRIESKEERLALQRTGPAQCMNATEWLSNLEIHARNWIFLGYNEDISQAGQHFAGTERFLCVSFLCYLYFLKCWSLRVHTFPTFHVYVLSLVISSIIL